MKKLLLLATLVLGVVSCMKDQPIEAGLTGDGNIVLSVGLPAEATRAAGIDSALGAIDNRLDLANEYDIRYILEVFDAHENLAKRVEKYEDTATETTFELRLIPGRHYSFVVWADFVKRNADGDVIMEHYDASDLRNIEVIGAQNAMDESRDAYTAVFNTATEDEGEVFSSASTISMILKRPFAKLRVVTNDIDEIYSDLLSASIVYNVDTYQAYDALTLKPSNLDRVTKTVDFTSDAYLYGGEPTAEGVQTLFADYLLGTETGSVQFVMTITDNVETLPAIAFNTAIPVERNHLTTIYGPVLTDFNKVTVSIDDNFEQPEHIVEHKKASTAEQLNDIFTELNESTTEEEVHIVLGDDINLDDLASLFTTRASSSTSITIASGKEVVLDIKNYSITGTDNETASFGLFNIQPGAKLTIEGNEGKIQLTAKNNRGWNAYSSVISNQRGEFVLNGGTIEHLGGTDMAYGLDILTNTGAGDAKATINGGVVKSTYRAIRQFLNSTKATAELVVNGGTIDGCYNKSIWMQNANNSVNPGKLVVGENANLYGDVMVSGAGAPELDIELSVAVEALKDGATVIPSNIPAGYAIYVKNDAYVVEKGVEENGNEVVLSNIGGLKWFADKVNAGDTFEGKTVVLSADIDLNNENWTPIGYWTTFNGTFDGQNHTISNLKHHGTEEDCYVGLFGYTENATIKNLTINNVDLKLVANASWAGGHMGALVGNIEGETVIENIKVTGDVKIDGNKEMAGAGRIGGVVGGNVAKVSFKNVVVDANAGSFVQGNTSIGGIAGQIQQVTTFENCSANIDVTAQVFYAGGIVGLAYQNTSFTNCVTSGKVSVLAGREGNNNDLYRVGAIAGGWDDHEDLTLVLEGCSTTCELFGASADGRTATAFDCAGYVGRGYSAVAGAKVSVNGTVYEYLANGAYKVDGKVVADNNDQFQAAIAAGETSIVLGKGTFNLPSSLVQKEGTLTIVGSGVENTILNGAVNSNNMHPGNYANGVALEFEGLTFKTANNGYNGGFGHAVSVTFRESKIVGQFYAHSDAPHYFYDCTIDPLTGYLYTYGSDCVFEGCTFAASEGKALQIYEDAASGENTVTITNCAFVATKQATTWDGKPVTGIDINSNGAKFEVYINNCTTTGFPTGLNSNSNLWNVKDAGKAHANVYVDGAQVWFAGYDVVANGLFKKENTYLVMTGEGLVALSGMTIKGGEIVTLGADIDLTGVEFNGLNAFNPEPNNTFDGQGYTVSNWTYEGGASDMGFIRDWVGPVKNVKFENCHLKTAGRSAVVAAKIYGNIENVSVNNCSIEDSYWACGLVAGLYNAGSVSNCTVTNSSVKSNGGTAAIVGVFNESAGERGLKNCSVSNTTINNTGAYGEAYSGGALVGMFNSSATFTIEGCTVSNNTLVGGYVYEKYPADESVTIIEK